MNPGPVSLDILMQFDALGFVSERAVVCICACSHQRVTQEKLFNLNSFAI